MKLRNIFLIGLSTVMLTLCGGTSTVENKQYQEDVSKIANDFDVSESDVDAKINAAVEYVNSNSSDSYKEPIRDTGLQKEVWDYCSHIAYEMALELEGEELENYMYSEAAKEFGITAEEAESMYNGYFDYLGSL